MKYLKKFNESISTNEIMFDEDMMTTTSMVLNITGFQKQIMDEISNTL